MKPPRPTAPFACAVLLGVATLAPTVTATPRVPPSTRVLSVLDHVRTTLRAGSYRHDTRVDERTGRYDWDCSGMAAWVLRRAAPGALAAIPHARPVAQDFAHVIHAAPDVTRAGRSGGAWLRVSRVGDARPGDVLAWQRPRWFPSHNTGHVAFVMAVPEAVPGGYLVRIADSTSYPHQDDTRSPGQTGYGQGTILVTTDPATGESTGYGWMGRYSGPWVVPTPVAIGRAVR